MLLHDLCQHYHPVEPRFVPRCQSAESAIKVQRRTRPHEVFDASFDKMTVTVLGARLSLTDFAADTLLWFPRRRPLCDQLAISNLLEYCTHYVPDNLFPTHDSEPVILEQDFSQYVREMEQDDLRIQKILRQQDEDSS